MLNSMFGHSCNRQTQTNGRSLWEQKSTLIQLDLSCHMWRAGCTWMSGNCLHLHSNKKKIKIASHASHLTVLGSRRTQKQPTRTQERHPIWFKDETDQDGMGFFNHLVNRNPVLIDNHLICFLGNLIPINCTTRHGSTLCKF